MANTLSYIGYILTMIGGILMIIFGAIALLGSAFLIFVPFAAIGAFSIGIVLIILGIIAVIGARSVSNLSWGIILLIIGIIGLSIGGIAAFLVIIGAILGLISRASGPAPTKSP